MVYQHSWVVAVVVIINPYMKGRMSSNFFKGNQSESEHNSRLYIQLAYDDVTDYNANNYTTEISPNKNECETTQVILCYNSFFYKVEIDRKRFS